MVAASGTPVVGTQAAPRAATAGGLTISVAYAENVGNTAATAAAFPVPWAGAPNTIFIGNLNPNTNECGSVAPCYDAGGIRLDNPGPTPVTVTNVVVDVHSSLPGGKLYNNLWGSFTVPAGKSVILTENPPAHNPGFDNFDSSDSPHGNCTPVSIAPTVKLTIGGAATTLVDSTHVLDTHAIDAGACPNKRNESIQWRQIGAAGGDNASLTLAPGTATRFAGQQLTETATLLDGSGFGLPNANVNFSVVGGPNSGQTGSGVTDASGHAAFSYAGAAQGEDIVVASAGAVGSFQSNQARVMWTNDSPDSPPWNGADIGNPTPAGSQAFVANTGTWTVNGGGRDINGAGDQFHFVWQNLAPPGGITARVASQTNSNPAAKSGLMLRSSSDPGAPYYGAFVTPGSGITIQDRSAQGGATSTVTSTPGAAPAYLWVASSGGTYTTYTSADGYLWQAVPGSSVSLGLGSPLLAGLAVTSHDTAQLSTATFDAIALTTSPPAPTPPVPCPSPWTCSDIGNPAVAGSATVANGSTWTIQGAGGDIHGTADQFQFDYRALPGDGSISAHVLSQSNTSPWAKAGVMLRSSLDPGATNYTLLVTPGNGLQIQYRPTQGASTAKKTTAPGTVPAYLKVSRVGTTFSAYTSADGVTWTLVPNSTITIGGLSGPLLQGLSDTSHNGGSLCTVTMDAVHPT